jgi:polysaccharide export outer membrane protein
MQIFFTFSYGICGKMSTFAPDLYIIKVEMNIKTLLGTGCMALFLASCTTPKNVSYFPTWTDGETLPLADTRGIVLKPADKLSIIVNTKSAELNNVLNLPVTSQIIGYTEIQSIAQSRGASGYTIDPEGYIDFPLVGKVKAAGMTRSELAAHLKRTMEETNVATDAVVTIEFMNLGYSVVGDVFKPGFFEFNSDRVNVLQALSMAGDMNITGNREAVKVIRTDGDKQKVYVLNLQDSKALTSSPGYYLQQNDIVYVDPNDYKKRQATANASEITKASFWLSAISVLTTVAVLIFK